MAAKKRDYTGIRVNHLTFLYPSEGQGAGRHVIWLVKCDCGRERTVDSHSVIRGKTKACGKCDLSYRLRSQGQREQKKEIQLYQRYVKGAEARGYSWQLTHEQVHGLIIQKCYYCGQVPRLFGGIDRRDNKQGYHIDNAVPCCSRCNMMKGKLSPRDFYEHALRIVQYVSFVQGQCLQQLNSTTQEPIGGPGYRRDLVSDLQVWSDEGSSSSKGESRKD